MATPRSNALVPNKPTVYSDLRGIDRSRGREAMDVGSGQHMWSMLDCYADWRGRIVTDAAYHERVGDSNANIQTLRFYRRDGVCWAQNDGFAVTLNSDRNHKAIDVFPKDTPVTDTVFRREVIMFAAGHTPYSYNGSLWVPSTASIKPAFGVAIQGRMAVAGMPNKPLEVQVCRAEDKSIFVAEEEVNSDNPLRAFFLDVSNLVDTAEEIQGLGLFESNRLCIFTQDRCIVYVADPDAEAWEIDDKANVNVGCISHRTIRRSEKETIFCSRYGVHVLSRTGTFGTYIVEDMLSEKIEDLYKELVASVTDPRFINACYDPDAGQYHIFFPQPGGELARRLTYSRRADFKRATWSEGKALHARCGDSLGGQLVFGTRGGPYNVVNRNVILSTNNQERADYYAEAEVETPILWHGSVEEQKNATNIILQAQGDGMIDVYAYNEEGDEMGSFSVELGRETADFEFPDTPLERQYRRPFPYVYRGCQLKFVLKPNPRITLSGFAIEIFKDR